MKDAASHPWDRPAAEQDAGRSCVFGLLPEDFERLGAPGRALHIFGMLHRPWTWREGAPRLSRPIREWLAANTLVGLPEIVDRRTSEDGATKVALRLQDGHLIEAVHMPRAVKNPRVTICLSSQVGCAMGCAFCATGSMGILRNLSAGEIVGQVLALLHNLGPEKPHAITLVFMGMGEPLHNLDNVHRAIRILNHTAGLNISAKRITVSTSGLVSGLERLATLSPRPWVALSLNATTDEARNRIMPVNRAWNLARLRQALAAWPLEAREKLTIEYVLLAGVNDTDGDAHRLAAWMGELRLRHNLNLIPFNAHEGSGYEPPSEARLQAFSDVLKGHGCFVTVRRSRGRDVQGACGQLVR